MLKRCSNSVLSLCVSAALAAGMVVYGSAAMAQAKSSSTQPAAQTTATPATATPVDENTLYALGAALANNLRDFHFTPAEKKIVQDAFLEVSGGKTPKVDVAAYMSKINSLFTQRQLIEAQQQKEAGAAYLAKAAKEPGATKLDGGIVIRTLKPGNGPKPTDKDSVKVLFSTTTIDGTKIENTADKTHQPIEFAMNAVIPCWMTVLKHMQVGSKSRFVCPADLAYGDTGNPPKIPPGAALVYELELTEIVKPAAPAAASGGAH